MGVIHSLSTFPNFALYFAAGTVLIALFLVLYSSLTPYREFVLIRQGNIAAAIALSGSLIGFALPLTSVISHSVGMIDLGIWGLIALFVQLGGFLVARLMLPRLPQAIEQGTVSDGIFVAGLSITLGLLNAACMAG